MRKVLWSKIRLILEFISLGTPESRIAILIILSLAIFFAPFSWLQDLSLYKRIGWESAPSIGLTRAYWLMLHGKVYESIDLNRLIIPVLAIGLPLIIFDFKSIFTKTS